MKKTSKVFISLLLAFTMLLCIPGGAVWAENATSVSSEIDTENPETEKLGTEDPEAEKPEPENQDAISSDAENYEAGNSANEVLDNSQPEGASEENKAEAGRLEDKNKLAAGGALKAVSDDDPYDGYRWIFIGGGNPIEPARLHPVEHGVVTVENKTRGGTTTSSRTTRVTGDAYEGDEIEVTVVPDPDYTLSGTDIKGLIVRGEAFDPDKFLDLQVTNRGNGVYSFTMPVYYLYAVQINPVFSAVPKYSVAIAVTENGSVKADKETAREGETVTLTVTPEEGAELKSLTVTKASGGTVAVTTNEDGTCSFTMPSENVTVSAAFTRAYTVTYKVVNGTWDDGTKADVSETVTEGGSPADVPTGMVAETGFRGGAWDTEPASAAITADTAFTYTFEKIPTVTVTFDSRGGSNVASQTVEYNTTADTPDRPSRDGWVFGGWFKDEGCTEEYDFSSPVTEDLTLYAGWYVRVSYSSYLTPDGTLSDNDKVKFNDNEPAGTAMYYVYEGSEVSLIPQPSEGYRFVGWISDEYDGKDPSLVFSSDAPLTFTCSLDAFADFSVKSFSGIGDAYCVKALFAPVVKYTITYNLNGGKLNGETGTVAVQVEDGTTITLPKPTKDGYTFDYWEGSKYEAGATYKVTGDHTFTAQWKAEADEEYSDTDSDTSDSGNSRKSSKKSKGVDTGDAADLMGWILLAIIAETGAVYVYRRRRNF